MTSELLNSNHLPRCAAGSHTLSTPGVRPRQLCLSAYQTTTNTPGTGPISVGW